MAKFIVRPRMVELYEIVKVRTILLYKTYEVAININNSLHSCVVEIKEPKVGDYLCIDEHYIITSHIKKENLKYFQEVD